jgi:hypothetical protein
MEHTVNISSRRMSLNSTVNSQTEQSLRSRVRDRMLCSSAWKERHHLIRNQQPTNVHGPWFSFNSKSIANALFCSVTMYRGRAGSSSSFRCRLNSRSLLNGRSKRIAHDRTRLSPRPAVRQKQWLQRTRPLLFPKASKRKQPHQFFDRRGCRLLFE